MPHHLICPLSNPSCSPIYLYRRMDPGLMINKHKKSCTMGNILECNPRWQFYFIMVRRDTVCASVASEKKEKTAIGERK